MNMLFSLAKMNSQSIEAIIGIVITIAVVLVIIAIPLALIALNFFVAQKMASIAAMKGHSRVWSFIFCFVLGVPGYFYVAALPDLTKRKQIEQIIGIIQTEKENPAAKEAPESAPTAEVK